jgi:hypothetical protein
VAAQARNSQLIKIHDPLHSAMGARVPPKRLDDGENADGGQQNPEHRNYVRRVRYITSDRASQNNDDEICPQPHVERPDACSLPLTFVQTMGVFTLWTLLGNIS